MTRHATPEEAVRAEDPVPARYMRVVAVERSPDNRHVEVEWGSSPTVRWGVRAPELPEPPPDARRL